VEEIRRGRTEAAADMKGGNDRINSQLFKQRESFEGALCKMGCASSL
jgi:hypothetical protein